MAISGISTNGPVPIPRRPSAPGERSVADPYRQTGGTNRTDETPTAQQAYAVQQAAVQVVARVAAAADSREASLERTRKDEDEEGAVETDDRSEGDDSPPDPGSFVDVSA